MHFVSGAFGCMMFAESSFSRPKKWLMLSSECCIYVNVHSTLLTEVRAAAAPWEVLHSREWGFAASYTCVALHIQLHACRATHRCLAISSGGSGSGAAKGKQQPGGPRDCHAQQGHRRGRWSRAGHRRWHVTSTPHLPPGALALTLSRHCVFPFSSWFEQLVCSSYPRVKVTR